MARNPRIRNEATGDGAADVIKNYQQRRVPFTSGDGMKLHLVNIRGSDRPTRGPVLLVHGAGVRGDLFRGPVQVNFVDALLSRGFDVWLENWRASIEVPANQWTLDQAAVFDHPAAVRTVVEDTGCRSIQAVIHCQGSTSFTMSAIAGLVPQVETIITNAVSLHPIVPHWSQWKLRFALPILKKITDRLDPQWGEAAPGIIPKVLAATVRAVHHECKNDVCKMVSFTYGAGFPALWSHELIDESTHEWLRHEFGAVPMSFFEQMARCVKAGHLVRCESRPELPMDFSIGKPKTDARWVFVAGKENRCFLAKSQERSFAHFERQAPGRHKLHVLPQYGHLDVFLGKTSARDVFPLLLDELKSMRTQ